MPPNSVVQNRAKHFKLLLARKLSLIEREHSQNLVIHQKLENSIRRDNNRTKIYTEQNGLIDYHDIRNNIHLNQRRRQSTGGNSNSNSYNHTNFDQSDEFFDDTSSYMSLQRRRYYTKNQRLPPIIKANTPNQHKLENKNQHWMTSFQQLNISKENLNEPFTTLDGEITKSNLSELTHIQRQVHSFLETLPTNKGVQHGFDSFASSSLYTNRAPIAIR